jgi:hypothetical protein
LMLPGHIYICISSSETKCKDKIFIVHTKRGSYLI